MGLELEINDIDLGILWSNKCIYRIATKKENEYIETMLHARLTILHFFFNKSSFCEYTLTFTSNMNTPFIFDKLLIFVATCLWQGYKDVGDK